jgi:hypothetical protein
LDRFGIFFDIIVDDVVFAGGGVVSCLSAGCTLELLRSAATTPEGHVDRREGEDWMEDNLDLLFLPLGFGVETKVSSDSLLLPFSSLGGSMDLVAVLDLGGGAALFSSVRPTVREPLLFGGGGLLEWPFGSGGTGGMTEDWPCFLPLASLGSSVLSGFARMRIFDFASGCFIFGWEATVLIPLRWVRLMGFVSGVDSVAGAFDFSPLIEDEANALVISSTELSLLFEVSPMLILPNLSSNPVSASSGGVSRSSKIAWLEMVRAPIISIIVFIAASWRSFVR